MARAAWVAVGSLLVGCATVSRTLEYEGGPRVPFTGVRAALSVAATVTLDGEVAPGFDVGSLADALEADLLHHGPFEIDPVAPEARLEVQVDLAEARSVSAAWFVPPFFWSLFGAPTESRELVARVSARLSSLAGQPIATASGLGECEVATGLYYGARVSFACALAPALVDVREKLAAQTPWILSRLARSASRTTARSVVAVLTLAEQASVLPPDEAEALTELLAVRAIELGFQVVPGAEVDAHIAARKRESHALCYDDACAIELGKAVAADKLLTFSVRRVGRACLSTLSLFDLEAELLEQATAETSDCAPEALMVAMRGTLGRLEPGYRRAGSGGSLLTSEVAPGNR